MDGSRSMGNGFSYQEKLSSSKLTSVLEAIAGEYALVINGHSLVGSSSWPWRPACCGSDRPLTAGLLPPWLWVQPHPAPRSPARPTRWRQTWRWSSWRRRAPARP